MSQKAYVEVGKVPIELNIPGEEVELTPGVSWGNVCGFPTVAYWFYRVLERRLQGNPVCYKLGGTLLEEVGACLLGGHGIPASMGIAAFEHMKRKGAFNGDIHPEDELYQWLSEPIEHNEKLAKYRFARQKARYLASAIQELAEHSAPVDDPIKLRNWLLKINGIGLKTASWIVRNWMSSDDVAILDIHIYRAGLLGGFFTPDMTIEKHYLQLEKKFVDLAKAMGVMASELDAVIWYEMQSASSVLKQLEAKFPTNKPERISHPATKNRQADAAQLSFA